MDVYIRTKMAFQSPENSRERQDDQERDSEGKVERQKGREYRKRLRIDRVLCVKCIHICQDTYVLLHM